MNRSLSRLRDHFKDELLVPKGRTYALTDRAEKLARVAAKATRSLVEALGRGAEHAQVELRQAPLARQLFSLGAPARGRRSPSNGA